MVKLVALLKARPGMSRGEFIERYEAVHAPLIGSLIPFFSAYRRSYPLRAVAPEHIEPPRLPESFDVLTELWYPGQAALDAQAKAIDGGAGTAIAQDEEEQFDRARMAMFVADERVTPASSLRPAPAGQSGQPPIRVTGLLKMRPGLSRADFIDYYEGRHVPLALEVMVGDDIPLFAAYSRSYPVPDQTFPIGTAEAAASIDFDVITDMWFWTEEDYQAFLARPAIPAVGAALLADEMKLFDRAAMVAFLAEEFITPPSALPPL